MSEKIYGGQIVKVVKQRCKPYSSFFNDKLITIIVFKPPENLTDRQMLAQYDAAVTSTNQKVKTFEFLGCNVARRELNAKTSSYQFLKILKDAVKNPDSIGIIVQNPIPNSKLKSKLEKIPPHLDIDGINQTSIFKASATSEAISKLVLSFVESDNRVAIVGSMGFVGSGVVKLLKAKNIDLIELDRSQGDSQGQIKQGVLNADLVVSATGKADLIQVDYLKPEHKLVIDAGFIPQADGTIKGDICKDAYDIPQYLTPVPGGVGPTQMAVLLERIFQVAKIELQPWDYQRDIVKPVQQERVEKIAPILMDYLKLNEKSKVERDNLIVEFDSDTKILTYQDKLNSQQYLKAQYKDNRWIDKGSNISQSREDYLLNVSAGKIKQLQDEKSKSMNCDPDNNQRRRQGRR